MRSPGRTARKEWAAARLRAAHCDDGLGWPVAVQLFRETASPEIEVLPCLQLTPELAETVRRAERVLFIDGTREGQPGDLRCDEVQPKGGSSFFTHELSPALLMGMARNLYGARPPAYVLTICGECFDVGECLSPAVAAHVPELKARVRGLVAEALHACAAVYRLVLRLQ